MLRFARATIAVGLWSYKTFDTGVFKLHLTAFGCPTHGILNITYFSKPICSLLFKLLLCVNVPVKDLTFF